MSTATTTTTTTTTRDKGDRYGPTEWAQTVTMAPDGGTRHHCNQHQIVLEQVSFQLTLQRA